MMRRSLIAPLLSFMFGACTDDSPSTCEALRACCASLDPAIAGSCQSSIDQAQALEDEAAEMHCTSALDGLRMVGQCAEHEDGGTGGGDSGAPDIAVRPNLPPSQGLSQPCDPRYGLDACGAALFCAAFDGRTIPTCYPEGVRTSGQSCGEDRHCATQSCNSTALRCRAGDDQSCEVGLGCASSDRYCSARSGNCQRIGSGADGEPCGSTAHCNSGLHCPNERCVPSGEEGSPCGSAAGCNGLLECVRGRCGWGRTEGAGCMTPEHCERGLVCEANTCQRAPGGPCTITETECRAGEYCQLTSITPEEATCIPEGPALRGELCYQGHACSGEMTCIAFEEDEGRCFAPCDPDVDDECGAGWECIGWSPLSFGICLALRCTPFSCGANEVCDQTFDLSREELLGCAPAGTAPLGGACANARCAEPGFCVNFGGGPRCEAPCDQDHPCLTGSCVWLDGADFGVCN